MYFCFLLLLCQRQCNFLRDVLLISNRSLVDSSRYQKRRIFQMFSGKTLLVSANEVVVFFLNNFLCVCSPTFLIFLPRNQSHVLGRCGFFLHPSAATLCGSHNLQTFRDSQLEHKSEHESDAISSRTRKIGFQIGSHRATKYFECVGALPLRRKRGRPRAPSVRRRTPGTQPTRRKR